MSRRLDGSRPDHIAELTRGARLPLESVSEVHLSVIFDTIIQVWNELKDCGLADIKDGDEAEVNSLLETRLNYHCQSLPLWKDVVHSVQRGRESMSYNGGKLEKRPDVSLVFLRGNRNFPMVFECKIIDKKNNKTVDLYCKKGINRFVVGEYAWASRQAVMLGYIRDGSTVRDHLVPHLADRAKLVPDPFQTIKLPELSSKGLPHVHNSEHGRSFKYISSESGQGPGAIILYHLWLH